MAESKTFPAAQDVKFILCEDVRREHTGKLLVIGLYPGEQVVMHRPKPIAETAGVAAIDSLVLLFIARNGLGEFAGRLAIEGPNGEPVLNGPMQKVELRESASGTLIAGFKPFPVRQFGHHRVTLFLDERPYCFAFEIREGAPVQREEKPDSKVRKKK